MNKKTRKLLTWCLVFSMILTQMLFTNVAFAADRHSGADRYQTALKIAQAGWTEADTVVIARGDDLADALAAAPLAYAKGKAPILLTAPDKLPEGLLDTLTTLGVKNVYIVGGTSAVSADVEKALADKVGAANVTRLMGASRVETALAVANAAFPTAPTGVVLAGAYAAADALSVSSIAAAKGMPILLVDGEMTADVAAYVSGKTVYAVGGTAVLSDAVVNAAKAERLAGANRYATNAAILDEFELDYSKIYLAKGEDGNMVDALAGSALAALTNSPIVLVDGSNSVAAAKEVLAKNIKDDSEVVVLGGTMALPDSVAAAVENLKPSTPAELAVKSVTADNLKEIVVTFNKAIDDDDLADEVEDAKNYTIKDSKNNKVNDAIESVELDEDKKVATITLKDKNNASPLENQEPYTLVIDEDILGEEYVAEFTPEDTELPKSTDAKVVGIDTIKVTFSEPLRPDNVVNNVPELDKKSFEVNGGELSIKRVELVNGNREANVILYSNLEDKEELTLKVKSEAEDYAGYSTYAATYKLTVVEDTEAPYVTGFKNATRTKVTLVFNEDIKDNGTIQAADIYHTNKNNMIINTGDNAPTISGNELTIHFADADKLPAGTAYIYIEEETIQDLWENKNPHITAKINIDEDNEKPTVKKIEQGDDTPDGKTKLVLTFSEDVEETTAEKKANYTVKDKDGDEVRIAKAERTDSDEVTLTMSDTLNAGEEYTVLAEGVEDLEGNKMVDYEGKVTIEDKAELDWTDVSVSAYELGKEDQRLIVDFGEPMTVGDNKYAIDDLDKYVLYKYTDANTNDKYDAGETLTKIYNIADAYEADIDAIDGNEKVEISLPYDSDDTDADPAKMVDLSGKNLVLLIARVADKAGNVTDTLYSPYIDVVANSTVAWDKTPRATDRDVIEFTFKDKVDLESDDFSVWASAATKAEDFTTVGATQLDIAKLASTSDGKGVKITLDEKLGYDAKVTTGSAVNVYVVVKNNPKTENADGAKIQSGAYLVSDKIAPAVATVKVGNDDYDNVRLVPIDANNVYIIITMAEAIDSTTLSKLTFETDNFDVTAIDLIGGNKEIRLKVHNDDPFVATDFYRGFGIDQKYGLEDVKGNEATDIHTELNFQADGTTLLAE